MVKLVDIREVISYIDEIKPNAFSDKIKTSWISDVDSSIRTELMKVYQYAEITTENDLIAYGLPMGVSFDDIVKIYINGKERDKLDYRSFIAVGTDQFSLPSGGTNIRIVWQLRAERYRYYVYPASVGTITYAIGQITNSKNDFSTLREGDTISISGSSIAANNKNAVITEIDIHGGYLKFEDGTFTAGTETNAITITRVLNDELIAIPPYDRIYQEYISAQIDWINKEYNGYNNGIARYNQTWKDLAAWYKSRNPVLSSKVSSVSNLW